MYKAIIVAGRTNHQAFKCLLYVLFIMIKHLQFEKISLNYLTSICEFKNEFGAYLPPFLLWGCACLTVYQGLRPSATEKIKAVQC